MFSYVFIIIVVVWKYYGNNILKGGGGGWGVYVTMIISGIFMSLSRVNVVFLFWSLFLVYATRVVSVIAGMQQFMFTCKIVYINHLCINRVVLLKSGLAT